MISVHDTILYCVQELEQTLVQREPVNFILGQQVKQTTATSSQRIETREMHIWHQEIWLILPEATAIGVRLSHASRKKLDSLHTAQ